MVFGIESLVNPLKLTDNITVKFYGDVAEYASEGRQCSILGMEFNDCLLIGGFFWQIRISKWAVVIGYLLGFRFSTKDEIKTAKKNKEKIIEVWNLLVDKYSDGENIWEFLKNLKEGEDFESIKTNIEMNFSAPKIVKNKKEQAERAIEEEKREKQVKENDITNNNIRRRFVKGDITLEKSIEEQNNFNKRIALEVAVEEGRKKERERRMKILNDNKITDEVIRHSFIKNRYDIKTAISEQERLNKQESHKTEMQEIIESYKFEYSQIYVLKNKLNVDLYTMPKEHLKDNCNKIKNLGLDVCRAIRNGNVIQGMNRKALIWSMGNSDDIDETVYKTKTKAYYYYHPYKTRQNNTRYKFRVDLENSIVVGWKDLH